MEHRLADYLGRVRAELRLTPSQERGILAELSTHVEEERQGLMLAGCLPEEASKRAVEALGPPRKLARSLWEAYSQGSWRQAFLAAAPHILLALIFALHFARMPVWLLLALVPFVVVAAYGWSHGQAPWFYPWLGYALTPLLIGFGATLFLVGKGFWLLFAQGNKHPLLWMGPAINILPLILWALVTISLKVMKRDWLYASLMAIPLPIVVSLSLLWGQQRFLGDEGRLYQMDLNFALIFLGIAGCVAIFIRLRQRPLKTAVLLTAFPPLFVLAWLNLDSRITLLGLLGLGLLSAVFILTPALLENRLVHRERRGVSDLLGELRQSPSRR